MDIHFLKDGLNEIKRKELKFHFLVLLVLCSPLKKGVPYPNMLGSDVGILTCMNAQIAIFLLSNTLFSEGPWSMNYVAFLIIYFQHMCA